MKATLWLWSLVTTLVYVSQQVSAESYTDTRILQPQDNSLVAPAKRTKASLSIVNPLDVLRQRIILEMARRRMQENSMQVARNKAILREIGKRSRDEFPQEETPLHFGSQDHFYYGKLPFLRRYSHAPDRQLGGILEYDMDPTENRKSAGTSSSNSINSRDRNDSDSATSEAGKQINDRKEISSSGRSSSSSGSSSGGVLTLAAEQRQLEREQQEAQQEANKILHSVAIVGPQEMRFSDERVMLPNGVGGNNDEDDDDGGNGDNGVDEGDEYFQGSNFPSGREQNQHQQQQQQQQQQQPLQQKDDRLKSDDYRLRYLYRIQGKYFG
ncbi:mushroom body large-type Kenyon cell-specific protein 1 [Ochlerotatus camptorhynchus]|uniref:mushroom body large-type Kenyon cell-specific protein 1 n=1 Tax=Ochlerotatus camptorhynchus TaxID=644619 RepID=UPI0031E07B92